MKTKLPVLSSILLASFFIIHSLGAIQESIPLSSFIYAIKTGNLKKISAAHIEDTSLNNLYRNKTPLMIAIEALGTEMLTKERLYDQRTNTEYKNIVSPTLFTLSAVLACKHFYAKRVALIEAKKKEGKGLKSNDITEVLLKDPLAIPGIILFAGVLWLSPDLFHNLKTWYAKITAPELLTMNLLENRYNIVTHLISQPTINLNSATKEGLLALDIIQQWQKKLSSESFRNVFYTLEQLVLEKSILPSAEQKNGL